MTSGFLRADGRKGIRNLILVVYLVECAHHVARVITVESRSRNVQLVGFPGCYPNEYALRIMQRVCTHPNVGGVLLVSLGCEGFNRDALARFIRASDRPVESIIIQENGGTSDSVHSGLQKVSSLLDTISETPRTPFRVEDLVVGTICGGSDGTSGISANPAVGRCFDRLVSDGATCIFEETGELIGCEHVMADRACTPELGKAIRHAVEKAENYYSTLGYGSFAPGNADGGLSSLEEKSLGAYAKSGNSQIHGLIKPGDIPPRGGLYLLDIVPDGEPRFGYPNISDNAEIVELIACGCHIILFTTGRGSVVGSAVSPVIKICANPDTYSKLSADMDINAGKIILGTATIDDVGDEIFDQTLRVAGHELTKSEELGHQEFILTYKTFEPIGPACLPHR